MHYVCNISGGVCSWYAARLIKEDWAQDDDEITLLFADTHCEDESTYAFVEQTGEDLDEEVVWVSDGRTVWELFGDLGFLGNSARTPCSRLLKRKVLDRWRDSHCDPEHTTEVLGMDWMEINRWERFADRQRSEGWQSLAPLVERGLGKHEAVAAARARGLVLPTLYDDGFSHANCAGACVKAGISHWRRLYHHRREVFDKAAREEASLRDKIGDEHSILRYQRGGRMYPLPLHALARDIESSLPMFGHDQTSEGGCGCAVDM